MINFADTSVAGVGEAPTNADGRTWAVPAPSRHHGRPLWRTQTNKKGN